MKHRYKSFFISCLLASLSVEGTQHGLVALEEGACRNPGLSRVREIGREVEKHFIGMLQRAPYPVSHVLAVTLLRGTDVVENRTKDVYLEDLQLPREEQEALMEILEGMHAFVDPRTAKEGQEKSLSELVACCRRATLTQASFLVGDVWAYRFPSSFLQRHEVWLSKQPWKEDLAGLGRRMAAATQPPSDPGVPGAGEKRSDTPVRSHDCGAGEWWKAVYNTICDGAGEA